MRLAVGLPARAGVICLLVGLLVVLSISAAFAASGDQLMASASTEPGVDGAVEGSIFGDGSGIRVEGSRGAGAGGVSERVEGGQGSTVPAGGGPAAEPRVDALEPSWGRDPDTGEACIALTRRPGVDPDSDAGLAWDLLTLEMMADPRLTGVGSPFCDDAVVAEVITRPDLAVNAFVRTVTLPSPVLRVDPGVALTGLPTFLVVAGQDGFSRAEDLAGWGVLEVSFEHVSLEIDWGDGTIEVVSDGRVGAPHGGDPSEQISHIYDHRDLDSEVVVTASWRARWSVAGFSGVVEGLAVDAALPLPVREYRAVRVASGG